jgi:uncharacterized protein with WD repeat
MARRLAQSQTGHDVPDSGDRVRRRPPRRHVVIVGLVVLSAAAMTIAGFAMHNAGGAAQQHASARTRLTADISPADPVPNRQQAAAAISSGVKAVAFSPDGQLLASAYSDGTIRLWNLATDHLHGPVLRVGSGSQTDVNAVAFSPDGQLLASGDADGTVQLWNPASGQPVGSALPVGGSVNAVAFSPDGRLLASADADGTVQLWNPATRLPVGSALPVDAHVIPQACAHVIPQGPGWCLFYLMSSFPVGTTRPGRLLGR